MNFRTITGSVALLLISNAAHAQIIIGTPDPQQVPALGAPILLVLGGLLAYVAYKFKSLGHGKLQTGLLAMGALTLLATGSGISLIERSNASGNFVAISARTDTSYTIQTGLINTFQNNSGITLQIKSIQLPGLCTNGDWGLAPANTPKCAANANIPATHSCYIRCD
ncbi:midcut-by-XrtH protein [Pseudoteredinibacter isoporae]|uniref:midcut-by-XrtH protein n=1 Tax=Pseudoteredinibacter isoporae TaxID=570281 RepID=UPI003341314E